jgi:predicted nucleic acid-binding protein
VRLYFDSSAVVKLVQPEVETRALRDFLRTHRSDGRVTSALARVEVVRVMLAGGLPAIERARVVLTGFDLLDLDVELLDRAATISPGTLLRSLDAIHLATAQSIGVELRALVTYDQRLAQAATALGMPVAAPV